MLIQTAVFCFFFTFVFFKEITVTGKPIKMNANLTLDDLRFTPRQKSQMKTRMFYKFATKWTNGVIPYTVDPVIERDSVRMNAIRGAIAVYHSRTCIRFVSRTNEQFYLNFMDGGAGRCYAYYGMSSAKQSLSLGEGCGTVGTVLHEIMHTLGFVHEHQRPDRDDYIDVDTTKIMKEYLYAFDKQQPETVDLMGMRYDYRSTMHYFSTAFGINNQVTITTKVKSMQNVIGMSDELSNCDMEKINKMYQCTQYIKNDPSCTMSQPPESTCSDSTTCPTFIANQPHLCSDYPGYYFPICKKSCNNCNSNRCEDSSHSIVFNYYCNSKLDCNDYGKRMACPKTCGLC